FAYLYGLVILILLSVELENSILDALCSVAYLVLLVLVLVILFRCSVVLLLFNNPSSLLTNYLFFSGQTTMGQDYSYSQPSSSSEFDMTSLLLAEAEAYADEAESSYPIEEPVQYPLQPEADEGIPTTCYCGAEPVVETSYTPRDPGRRYFSCVNVDDGDCHIWKWWDVAIMEEMHDFQRQIRLLKDQFFETDQKVAKLEKTVGLLRKKNSGVAKGVCLLVMVITVMILCWKSFGGFKPQRLNSRLSCQSDADHPLNMNDTTGFSSNSKGRSHGVVKVVVPHVSQVTGSCVSV
ncbi:hypothetical protein IGI04_002901, partial [Brassica rapa subsp. trilocularis]